MSLIGMPRSVLSPGCQAMKRIQLFEFEHAKTHQAATH